MTDHRIISAQDLSSRRALNSVQSEEASGVAYANVVAREMRALHSLRPTEGRRSGCARAALRFDSARFPAERRSRGYLFSGHTHTRARAQNTTNIWVSHPCVYFYA